MSKIFNDYLVGTERELAIESAYYDNLFSRLDTMLEMVELQYEQKVKDCEFKVFSESGTMDDYQYLIEDATSQKTEDQKSILKKMLEGIINFFKNLGNSIKKLFTGKDLDAEVEVDTGVLDAIKHLKSKSGDINAAGENIKKGGIINIVKNVGIFTGLFFVTGVTKEVLDKTGVTQKVKASLLESDIKIINGISNKVADIASWVSGKFGEITSKLSDKLGGIVSGIKPLEIVTNFIKSILDNIRSAVETATGAVADAAINTTQKVADKFKGGKTQNSDEQNGNTDEQMENDKAAGRNGVTTKRDGGYEYRIDKNNGNVTRYDLTQNLQTKQIEADETSGTSVSLNDLPNNVKKLAQAAKGKAAVAQKEAHDKSVEQQSNLNHKRTIGEKLKGMPSPENVPQDGHAHAINGKYYKNDNGTVIDVTKDVAAARKKNEQYIKQVPKENKNAAKDHAVAQKQATKQDNQTLKAQEGYDIDDLFEDESYYDEAAYDAIESLIMEGYEIEETDDEIIIKETADVGYVSSTSESIFGEEDSEIDESVQLDDELRNLVELFGTI